MSLHQYTSFSVELRPQLPIRLAVANRWVWKKLDSAKLQVFLVSLDIPHLEDAQSGAQILSELLESACDSCMPRGKCSWGKKTYILVDEGHR